MKAWTWIIQLLWRWTWIVESGGGDHSLFLSLFHVATSNTAYAMRNRIETVWRSNSHLCSFIVSNPSLYSLQWFGWGSLAVFFLWERATCLDQINRNSSLLPWHRDRSDQSVTDGCNLEPRKGLLIDGRTNQNNEASLNHIIWLSSGGSLVPGWADEGRTHLSGNLGWLSNLTLQSNQLLLPDIPFQTSLPLISCNLAWEGTIFIGIMMIMPKRNDQ